MDLTLDGHAQDWSQVLSHRDWTEIKSLWLGIFAGIEDSVVLKILMLRYLRACIFPILIHYL